MFTISRVMCPVMGLGLVLTVQRDFRNITLYRLQLVAPRPQASMKFMWLPISTVPQACHRCGALEDRNISILSQTVQATCSVPCLTEL